ncbi:MAG TPA: AAA family ATPase [Chloroflexota bacterium]|nr:AAA family ATPase [Chloroflexota bacterium]
MARALALPAEQRARFEAAASPAPRRRGPSADAALHRARVSGEVVAPAPAAGPEPAPPSLRCPNCAAANVPSARFCHGCGCGLTAHAPERPAIAPHPAEAPPAGPGALEGERKQVTVLVAELAGATELAERLDLEATEALFDGAVRTMMAATRDFEGTVSQVQGDGILALFGAPVAHEDHAVRACYAALALRAAVGRYAMAAGRTGGELGLRIALNSGEVVARAIGDDSAVPGPTTAANSSLGGSPLGPGQSPRLNYLARGRAVQLAASLAQATGAGRIVLTAQTLGLVEEYVEVRALGPLALPDRAEPVVAFELLGPGPARTRLQALAARSLTPFVGRQRELAAFHAALDQAAAGRGQVVALVGEPGLGKSRLIREAIRATGAAGWLVLDSGALLHARATPYLPIVDLLKACCQINSRDDPVTVREKLVGTIRGLNPDLGPGLPALLALLDLPVDPLAGSGHAAWQSLGPSERRRQTIDAVKRLLLRVSEQHPLLLVIEDLHWLDEASQALLDSLVESLPATRILLLASYRPEYRHGWGGKSYYAQLRIDSLTGEDAEALLDALLGPESQAATGGGPPLPALRRLLLERTEGNPFFLEECVRTLIDTGALAGEPGAYRLAKDVPTIDVPATVQAVLMARIDRLPPVQKRLLQTAAVVGTDVPYRVLEAIADDIVAPTAADPTDQVPIHGALTRLQAAELLYEARLFPELEYTFKHALTHDVAYGSLLQDRRRSLHARVVQAMQALYTDRLAERVETLAEHAFRGEQWGDAVTYLRQAGEKAVSRSASHDAAWFERALEALEHLPEDPTTLSQAVDLHLAARHSLHEAGQYGRVFDHLQRAQALAERLDDRRRQGWIAVYTCTHFYMLGDHRASIAAGHRAQIMAARLGDPALESEARSRTSWGHHARGEYERAIALNREVARGSRGRGEFHHFESVGGPPVFARTWLGLSLAERGEFEEGIAFGEEGIEIAASYGLAWSRAAADVGLGVVHLRRGELARAIELLERSYALSKTAGIDNWAPNCGAALGYALALSGRLDDAIAVLERTADPATAGFVANGSLRVAYLGEALLLAGRLDAARQVAARGLELAEVHQERGNRAWVLRLLGETASHRDPPDLAAAEAAYHQALSLAEQLGMRPLQAHCHLGLGKLYRRVGRLDEARTELATAVTMLREMGMEYWLPEAERELAGAN